VGLARDPRGLLEQPSELGTPGCPTPLSSAGRRQGPCGYTANVPECDALSRQRVLQRALPLALQESAKVQSGGPEVLSTLAQVSSFFLAVRPDSRESLLPLTSLPTYWNSLASFSAADNPLPSASFPPTEPLR